MEGFKLLRLSGLVRWDPYPPRPASPVRGKGEKTEQQKTVLPSCRRKPVSTKGNQPPWQVIPYASIHQFFQEIKETYDAPWTAEPWNLRSYKFNFLMHLCLILYYSRLWSRRLENRPTTFRGGRKVMKCVFWANSWHFSRVTYAGNWNSHGVYRLSEWRTNHQKLNLERYDRRLLIYSEVMKVLSIIMRDARISYQELISFRLSVSEADFFIRIRNFRVPLRRVFDG